MMIQQQHQGVTPTPKKRKGHFTKSRLKLLKKDAASGGLSSSAIISAPSGRKKNILFYLVAVIPALSFFWGEGHRTKIFFGPFSFSLFVRFSPPYQFDPFANGLGETGALDATKW
jgi:hypothetical protein